MVPTHVISYRAPNGTLTDKEIAKVRTGIVKQLECERGASIRVG